MITGKRTTNVLTVSIAAGLLLCGVVAMGQTHVVDGTGPDYINNGSFESGSDGAPVDWKGKETFGSANLADDLGIDLAMIHRRDATPSDGTNYTVVGKMGSSGDMYGVYLDTGYDLALGDTFHLSFYHGEHGSLEGDETFKWQLFTTTTGDDSGTVEDVIASGTNGVNDSTTLTIASFTGIGSVTAASAGERLFLAFTPVTAVAGEYIALDQVNLQVIPQGVVVDGTAPDYVNNGSFESGSDGAPVYWKGKETFGSTTLANDLGIDLAMIHRRDATPSDGTNYTVVGKMGSSGDMYGVYLDTGYDLALGDTFHLSFYHGEHGSLEGDETFKWQLFTTTTGDDSGTVEDVIASGTNGVNDSTTLTIASFTGIGSVTAASAGERLFLAFTPVTAAAGDYIALDQVNLLIPPRGTVVTIR